MNQKVVKSNALAAAVRGFTLGESRLLTCVLAQIRMDEQYSPETLYTVTASDLVNLTRSAPEKYRIQRRTASQVIIRSAERLYQRNIVIDNGEGNYTQQRWTSYMEVETGKSQVSFNIAPHIAGYLYQLSEKFLVYKASEAVAFTSKYALPIYEKLMEWHDKGTYETKYTTLREQIGIGDKYQDINNFRTRILDKAVADITACTQYEVKYEIRKRDNQHWIIFKYYIKNKSKLQKKPLIKVAEQPPNRLAEYAKALAERKKL